MPSRSDIRAFCTWLEDDLLFRRCEQAHEPPVVERVALGSEPVERAMAFMTELIGVDDVERLVHECEEVLAHPRHARELRPMRDLVDGDP